LHTALAAGSDGSLITPQDVCTLDDDCAMPANAVANIAVPNAARNVWDNPFCDKR
jgi:hypothetical protein